MGSCAGPSAGRADPASSLQTDYCETLPPLSVHSLASEVSTQPLPLHEFWPLQSWPPPLQAPWPLQSLAPTHWTFAALPLAPASCAIAVRATNASATADASSAPLTLAFIPFSFLRGESPSSLYDDRPNLCWTCGARSYIDRSTVTTAPRIWFRQELCPGSLHILGAYSEGFRTRSHAGPCGERRDRPIWRNFPPH